MKTRKYVFTILAALTFGTVANAQRISPQSGDFTVVLNSKGLASVSNQRWMESIPDLKQSLENVGRALAPKISRGRRSLTLRISPRGVITSSDSAIVPNGSSAAGLLQQYGNLRTKARIATVAFPKPGAVIFEPPIDLKLVPNIAAALERHTEVVRANEAIQRQTVKVVQASNGRVTPSFPRLPDGCFDLWKLEWDGAPAYKTKYDEFKECVGEYWYLPGVALVACAIGAGISSATS